jgi:TMEM175 potassium channel family protein
MGENQFTSGPTALYGVVLLMAAIAYYLLQQAIIRTRGEGSILKEAIGRDWKGKLSPASYIVAVIATLRSSWLARVVVSGSITIET